MPLDRAHVTAASRIMLPVYVVFFASQGINYTTSPLADLLASPGLAYTNRLVSIRVWGLLFLAAAAVMLIALFRRRREWYTAALYFAMLCMSIFAAALFAAAVVGNTSFGAWLWPGFVTAACAASYRSLNVRERD